MSSMRKTQHLKRVLERGLARDFGVGDSRPDLVMPGLFTRGDLVRLFGLSDWNDFDDLARFLLHNHKRGHLFHGKDEDGEFF